MTMPQQGTHDERRVREFSNQKLASALDRVRVAPRGTPRAERDVLLEEAARRLRWTDSYLKHAAEG